MKHAVRSPHIAYKLSAIKQRDPNRYRSQHPRIILGTSTHTSAFVMSGTQELPESMRAELSVQLRRRQSERAAHAQNGRSALVDSSFNDAVTAFTAAIMLTVAVSHTDVQALVRSNKWLPSDARRAELGQLYGGRAIAHIRLENWMVALEDSHAAYFLEGGSQGTLSQFAAAAAGVCQLPQEPVSFFSRDRPDHLDDSQAAQLAVALTGQLCHGLVADVFSYLADGYDPDTERAAYLETIASRDRHAARSHSGLHPLGPRSAAGDGLTARQAYEMMAHTIQSLAYEEVDAERRTPPAAILAQKLITLAAFRLGCTERCLEWRPSSIGKLGDDRAVDVWLRWKAEGAPASGEEGETERAQLGEGQAVRIVGLKKRPDLNGKEATIVAYDDVKDRYRLRVAAGTKGVLLSLKARNLVVQAATDATGNL